MIRSSGIIGRISLLLCLVICSFGASSAQDKTLQPEWWFGGAGGANFNYFGGEVHTLNATTTSIVPFNKGAGTGLYLSPLVEYQPDPVWGGMLHLGFDSRRGSFDDVASADTNASLS